ncbi:MAG: hypothetical protein Q4A41_00720 [Bacillota bacterium]|nr:hypothetical protein [Bacillota bacterium]
MKLHVTIFVGIMLLAFLYIGNVSGNNAAEEITNAENAIQKAAITCYALEGGYPSLDYLVENYGILLNKDEFIYHYEMIGSNILPIIKVMRK